MQLFINHIFLTFVGIIAYDSSTRLLKLNVCHAIKLILTATAALLQSFWICIYAISDVYRPHRQPEKFLIKRKAQIARFTLSSRRVRCIYLNRHVDTSRNVSAK